MSERYIVRGCDSEGWYYLESFDDEDDAIQDCADFADYHYGHAFEAFVLDTKNDEIIYKREWALWMQEEAS